MLVVVPSNRKPGGVTVDGSCVQNKQQSPHTGASRSILQNRHANAAGECFEYFLGIIAKRKKLLKQGRNCPISVTSLLASSADGGFVGCGAEKSVEMSAFYSNPPRKPLLPTVNLRLGNRVLRLESQSQTAECFGKLTRALAWETASSLMQQRSQSLTAKHVEEGRSGGALNLAANLQSAHSLGRLCDSCDWSKCGRMQLREREALGLGWVIQNESQSGICWNEISAVGQAALLRQGFPRGEPQEWPSLMHAEGNYWAVQQTSHMLD